MKGKNKWLSLFFALAIILITLLPNALTALNISTDSINESHITAIQIKQKTDGLAPFDADNTAGNDANNANNIVRSFDSVNYTLEYVTELKTNTPISDAYLMIEFTLPYTKDIATFDMESMAWMENPILTERNGMQILTGKRHLQNTTDNNAIPGAGTLSVGIKIQGAPNGTVVTPSFKLWMEGNAETEKKSLSDSTTVSAAPKYNIQITKNNFCDYIGYYNFTTGERSFENDGQGKYGRMQGYGITVSLYNDNAAKGLKGIELPSGNLEFDLELFESFNSNIDPELTANPEYTPLLWDYTTNTTNGYSSNRGTNNRNLLYNNSSLSTYMNNLPGNKRGSIYNSCCDGGNWNIVQTGTNSYHITLSNYKIDGTFPTYDISHTPTTGSPIYGDNVGCFSVGYMQVLCRFPQNTTVTQNIYLTAKTSNLKVTSVSNQQGKEMQDADNTHVSSITLYPPGTISKDIRLSNMNYNYPNGLGGGPAQTISTTYDRGDAALLKGENFLMQSPLYRLTDYRVHALNYLQKFDDKGFRIDPNLDNHIIWNWQTMTKIENVTKLFAAKRDKTGWTNLTEQTLTRDTELVYFESLEALESEGYTCVGLLFEVRDEELYTGSYNVIAGASISLIVRDDAATNVTYAMTSDFDVWEYDMDFTFRGNTSISKPTPTAFFYTDLTSAGFGVYGKTEYDENGKMIVGTHYGGCRWGQTVLVVGYDSGISKEITNTDKNGNIKVVFDMDANERTVNYKLIANTVASANTPTNKTTTLYITDTLPKDLTYNQGTAYYNNAPINPQVTVNSDGSTTLTWILEDVVIGKQLPAITYSCTIGKQGTNQDVQNNQNINTTASIRGDEDLKVPSIYFGNHDEVSFSVVKLNAISISKSTSTPYVSLSQNFDFTLKYANNSENPIYNSKLYDILPYKGDARGSDFEGFYKINSITINFVHAPKTFTNFTTNNYTVGYITTQNIPANDFATINAINNWTTITNKSIDSVNKTVTYTGLPEGVTGLVFNMQLEGLEYIEILLNMTPTGPQEEGDLYINGFYQYGQGQSEQVHSNHVAVQVYGHLDVTKIWQDDGNKYNTRSSSLDIKVYQDGNEYRNITLTPNNAMANSPDKWAQRIDNVPMYDALGNPHTYTIQEDLTDINQNFYFDAMYDQDNLTVTNIGIWVKNNEYPEYMIIINKDIINQNNQPATKEDFDKIKLDINNNQEFQIVLKQLNRTIINNGTTLSESYSGYSGNEYHGIVTDNNQLIFRNIPAGKYEVSENIIQYFEFIGIEKIENSEHATFTIENGKYYITLSGLHENDEYVEVKVTNKIEPDRPYDDSPSKDNLFKNRSN